MNEKLTPQKERFLQELERKLLRKELDAKLMEDGCSTSDGTNIHSALLMETAQFASGQRILRGRK